MVSELVCVTYSDLTNAVSVWCYYAFVKLLSDLTNVQASGMLLSGVERSLVKLFYFLLDVLTKSRI